MKNGHAQREKRRARLRAYLESISICRNCQGKGYHWFPASLGEHGFFICEEK